VINDDEAMVRIVFRNINKTDAKVSLPDYNDPSARLLINGIVF
jgi:hypothetical protein